MDIVSIGFIVTIILLGGLIAYLADHLGRNIGKKKLTIFSLRPKNTATLLAIASGVIIPSITIVFMMSLSKDVRTWMLQGRTILKEKIEKEFELKQMTLKADLKAKEVSSLIIKQNDIQSKLNLIQDKLSKTLSQNTKLNIEHSDLIKTINKSKAEYHQLESMLKPLHTKINTLEHQKDLLQNEVDLLTTQNTFTKQEILEKSAQLRELRNVIEQEKTKSQKLMEVNKNLLEGFDSHLYATRFQQMIYHAGSLITEIEILKPKTKNESTILIQDILKRASDEVKKRGAIDAADSVVLTSIHASGSKKTISVNDQIDWIKTKLASIKVPSKLSVHAFWNTFAGEKVVVILKISPLK